MNTSSNGYVMGFAVTVCVVISTALAFTATSLKSTQEAAAEFDRQKNVMMAVGIVKADDTRPRGELEALYKQRFAEVVVDTKDGVVAAGKTVEDVQKMKSAEDKKRYRVVVLSKTEDGKPDSYVLPISGKGLWSTIYGYLALEGDLDHVRGVTFYKHGETPGLGGECENPAWCATWSGKSILDAQKKLVGVAVKKGKVDGSIPAEKAHKVDGLSGATITSNGITNFVLADLKAFDGYLTGLRSK
ncbi:MAG: NADH:ubiquinone reductase (Na(+)-transporting) subunit C [Planctomycetes bacterium]|nr:NADH:ubiquinone reductase (Na(+)-transporting) subunit C [Planctomycetota bacterium]MCC7063468.1 NADH:ubiquinone reductase (Na(+)-transporting) subunit C [Planctomycetota bacterium]